MYASHAAGGARFRRELLVRKWVAKRQRPHFVAAQKRSLILTGLVISTQGREETTAGNASH